MSNPYFSNSAVFGGKADKDVQRTNAQMDPRFAATTSAQYGATDAASLNSMYNSPAATTADTGRMTYDDVIMKTGGMLAVLVLSGAATWIVAPQLFFVGAIVGLVLGLVNAFKKEPSPVLITLYSIAQGFSWAGSPSSTKPPTTVLSSKQSLERSPSLWSRCSCTGPAKCG